MTSVPDRAPVQPVAAAITPPAEHRGDEIAERTRASVEVEGTRSVVRRRVVGRRVVGRRARRRARRPAEPSRASG